MAWIWERWDYCFLVETGSIELGGKSLENPWFKWIAAQSGDPRKVAEFWRISSNNHHHKGGRKALIDCWWLISLTKSTGVIFLMINQLIMIVLDDCWWLTTLTPTTGRLAAFFKLLCQRRTQASRRRILRPWAKPMPHPCSKARTMSFLLGEGKVSSEAGVDYLDISWYFEIDLNWLFVPQFLSRFPRPQYGSYGMKPAEFAGFFCGFSMCRWDRSSRSQLGGDWIQQHFSITDSNDPSIASLRQKLIKARGQLRVGSKNGYPQWMMKTILKPYLESMSEHQWTSEIDIVSHEFGAVGF